MGKTDVLVLPLAIAAFVAKHSDTIRRGNSIQHENIETSTPDGTWNATNMPSDGSYGVRVIYSPNQLVFMSAQNRLTALNQEKVRLAPIAAARPSHDMPKPTAKKLETDAKVAGEELKKVQVEIDELLEEMAINMASKSFTIPFLDTPYVTLTATDAIPVEPKTKKPAKVKEVTKEEEPEAPINVNDAPIEPDVDAEGVEYKVNEDGTKLQAVKGGVVINEVAFMDPITEKTSEEDKTTLWNLAVEELEKLAQG